MASHHLTVFGNEVALDGRSIDVPAGANPHTIAVRAAKEMASAESKPGESVHIEVRNDQGVFPLVITDGEVSAGRVEPTASDAGSADTGEPANSRGIESATEPSRAEPAAGTMQSLHSAEGASTPRAPEPADDDAPAATGWKDGGDIVTSLRSAWAANAEVRPLPGPQPAGKASDVSQATPVFAPPEPRAPEAHQPFEHTFIEKHRTETPTPAPVGGFAGVLAQFGIGGPSQAQQAEEADKIAVSKVWTRPKGIAVANGKGGSGKTPTSLYLAAMFARLGGGMVLVDDNNTFRGAAGWQTENAAHGATKEDLIAALPTFDGSERAADMARFTHHQTTDRYDVLQSRPQKLARDQALDDAEFDAIQELLRRFYRVVVFDSGNDESAPNWLRMIHHSDALVVPTATTPKHCESAKLLLEALTAAGGHGAELARNAVIVVSHASTNDPAPEQVAPRFEGMAREVLTIPHDPAMAREWLRWDDLAPRTQRAWLAVGAAIARGLED
ncbi:AAA family ATPase [Dermacoccus abyssi]